MGADFTDKLVSFRVIIVVMLILTDGNAHCIAVIYGRVAGGVNIICRNEDVLAGHVDGQIYGVELLRGLDKVEVRVNRSAVALLTGGAADEVNRAVFVHLTALERLSSRIGVVMAGEYDVYTGFIDSGGNQLIDFRVAAAHIGIVGGLVHTQHLPGAACLSGIRLQPFKRIPELCLRAGVVYDCDVHIAARYGVVAACALGGHVVYGCRCTADAVAGILVVAEDVEHLRAAEVISTEETYNIHPVAVVGGIVHRVTGLNAVVVAGGLDIIHDSRDIGQILGLNIAKHKEAGAGAGLEASYIRPFIAAADGIIIAYAGLEIAQSYAVDHGRSVFARNEGAKLGLCLDSGPVLSARGGVLYGLRIDACCVAEPAYVLLSTGAAGGIHHNAVGLAVLSGLVLVGDNAAIEGDVALLVLGKHNIGACFGAELIGHELAALIGYAEKLTILSVVHEI